MIFFLVNGKQNCLMVSCPDWPFPHQPPLRLIIIPRWRLRGFGLPFEKFHIFRKLFNRYWQNCLTILLDSDEKKIRNFDVNGKRPFRILAVL